jgi:hypothetical protein
VPSALISAINPQGLEESETNQTMCPRRGHRRPGRVVELIMHLCILALSAALLTFILPGWSLAEPASATICPPMSFPNPQQNLAANPGFDIGSANPVSCQGPSCNSYPPSAAADWKMHSDNSGSKITTKRIPSAVPEKGGAWMLQVLANGTESGVFQQLAQSTARRMFSVWVRVRKGQVGIQLQGGTTGPAAFSTKIGEWEELRVCTDGTVSSDFIVIYNQASGGGSFEVDRVEVRDTP